MEIRYNWETENENHNVPAFYMPLGYQMRNEPLDVRKLHNSGSQQQQQQQ